MQIRKSEMDQFWCISMTNNVKSCKTNQWNSQELFEYFASYTHVSTPGVLVWLFTQPSNKPIYQLHFTAMLSTLNWWSSFPQVLYPNKPNFIELVRLDGRYDLGHSGGGLRRRQLLPDMGHQPPPNPIRPRRITQIWVICATSILTCS